MTTKYRTYTDEELLRQWDSLEPIYLLAEAKLRMEHLLDHDSEVLEELRSELAGAEEEIERLDHDNGNLDDECTRLREECDRLTAELADARPKD